MKAHQHLALAHHMPHAEPRATPIVPCAAHDWRKQMIGSDSGEVPELVLEHALLHRELGCRVDVLHAAAATDSVGRARGHDPGARGPQDFERLRPVVATASLDRLCNHPLAGKSIVNEDHAAVETRHPAALEIDAFNLQQQSPVFAGFPRLRNGIAAAHACGQACSKFSQRRSPVSSTTLRANSSSRRYCS